MWGAGIIIAFVILSLASVGVALSRYHPATLIEISLPTGNAFGRDIQIQGGVVNPGIYPFSSQDSISSLLDAAGGLTGEDQSTITLNVSPQSGLKEPQRINLNTASVWLLEALPGIGETKAKAIVSYRETNGPFKHIFEIMQVAGIGQSLYDEIKELITVTD
jgi:competence protein ComEA